MSNIDKQELRVPEREKHDWSQAVMRDCDFCQQWSLTVKRSDGECICASCCDSEYTSALSCALVEAIARAEAAEKRISEPMAWLWINERSDKKHVSLVNPETVADTQDALACGWRYQPLVAVIGKGAAQ
jgi:hypothetical protein